MAASVMGVLTLIVSILGLVVRLAQIITPLIKDEDCKLKEHLPSIASAQQELSKWLKGQDAKETGRDTRRREIVEHMAKQAVEDAGVHDPDVLASIAGHRTTKDV